MEPNLYAIEESSDYFLILIFKEKLILETNKNFYGVSLIKDSSIALSTPYTQSKGHQTPLKMEKIYLQNLGR